MLVRGLLGMAITSTLSPLPTSLKYSLYLVMSAVADIKTNLPRVPTVTNQQAGRQLVIYLVRWQPLLLNANIL